MGCGVSRISPLDSNSGSVEQQTKSWNNFQNFLLNNRQTSKNINPTKILKISQHVQTDDMLFGFKCQHSQTDNTIMSDEEYESMILVLQESEIKNDKQDIQSLSQEEEHEDDAFLLSNRNGIRQKFAISHAAIQATVIKRDKSNQTKYGSIDYRFNENKIIQDETKVFDELISFINQEREICDENENQEKQPTLSAKLRLKDIGKKLCLQGKQTEQFQLCLQSIMGQVRAPKKRDVELQTVNDILTDESPIYAARPPLRLKHELIASITLFKELDRKVLSFPEIKTLSELVRLIKTTAKNEMFRLRATFVWITKNIRHTKNDRFDNRISSEVLQTREGNSHEFASLFADIGRMIGFRVKILQGFIRGPFHPPGYIFIPNENRLEYWNSVFVASSWRAIDCYLGAGYFNSITGEFEQNRNEFYFLSDSSSMIWSHFPYSEDENNYERWQLLDRPMSLSTFNSLPKVTENFFEYGLVVRSRLSGTEIMFRIATEIKIGSPEAMRYKYKLYHANQSENSSLNHYVFSQLKEERLVGSFMISPPVEGRFFLKIFGRPEREMYETEQDLQAVLPTVITFALNCTKAKKYIEPYPLNDLSWGPTQKFYDFRLKLLNQKGPIVVTWGSRRRLVFECTEAMLFTVSLFDSESEEIDTKDVIIREDNGLKTILTINPPRMGTFRLMLYGMPKPKQKGKWRLPLLASFMIDCKLTKLTIHDDDNNPVHLPIQSTKDDKNK